jgi:hypothetical protein
LISWWADRTQNGAICYDLILPMTCGFHETSRPNENEVVKRPMSKYTARAH